MRIRILLCLLFLSLYIQADNPSLWERAKAWVTGSKSDNMWEEVKKLEKEDKYNAAQKVVEKIYDNAVASKNQEEWQKALIYLVALEGGLHGYENAVKILWEKPWPTGELQESFLHLYLANTLMAYYHAYSWEINQREKIITSKPLDLKKWTAFEIFDEINKEYSLAYKSKELLGTKSIKEFPDYIKRHGYPDTMLATVRDFLVMQWVNFLGNTVTWTPVQLKEKHLLSFEAMAQNPEQRTRMTEHYLSDTTQHPMMRIVYLLDELYYWNQSKNRKDCMLETQLIRIQKLNSIFTAKEEKKALKEHLQSLLKNYTDISWWAVGQYQLALFGQDDNDFIIAHKLAKEGAEKYPGTLGGKKCLNLMKSIELPSFSINIMSLDCLNASSLTISHRNIDKLYFRAYKLDFEQLLKSKEHYLQNIYSNSLKLLIKDKKFNTAWTIGLENTGDYKTHTSHIVPQVREHGLYAIIASYTPNFLDETNNSKNFVSGTLFLVSDYVTMINSSSKNAEVFVMNGKTGTPIPNADVCLYSYIYNQDTELKTTLKTNENGIAILPKNNSNNRTFIVARVNNQVSLDKSFFYPYYSNPDYKKTGLFIYTDRSIYRPLQKLYYKVVSYSGNSNTGKYKVLANTDIIVTFKDSNGKKIAEQTVTSNEYGTISGEFDIPTGRALGYYSLSAQAKNIDRNQHINNRASIRVEEYKRPTFEVTLQEPESALQLNKNLKLKGNARYYFGMPVTTGTVKYRITRETVFPWWFWWFYSNEDAKSTYEVTSGTTSISQDGQFTIPFMPKADPKLNPNIYYRFKVTAEVTDEGGETRETIKEYPIGFISVQANIQKKYNYFLPNEVITLDINKTDLSAVPQSGAGEYKLVSLQIPDKVMTPDQLPRSAEHFGQYAIAGDKVRSRWEPDQPLEQYLYFFKDGQTIESNPCIHDNDGKARVTFYNLPAGAYRLYYTTNDNFGQKYQTQKEFLVVDENVKLGIPFIFLPRTNQAKVGEKVTLFLSSGVTNQSYWYEHFLNNKRQDFRLFRQTKNQFIEIPITEKYRGGFSVRLFACLDYRCFNLSKNIYVPWDNKELKITFSHFRDLLLPGQKEKWDITIHSASGEKAAAEVLAYMYDRSLDFFGTHRYPSFSQLFGSKTGASSLRNNLSHNYFTTLVSNNWYDLPTTTEWSEDTFISFNGYSIGGLGRRRYYNRAYKNAPMMQDMLYKNSVKSYNSMVRGELDTLEEASEPLPVAAVVQSASGAINQALDNAETQEELQEVEIDESNLRSDFRETAFFYPHLRTDEEGNVHIEFTAPDSVTAWNLYIHALTQDLCYMTTCKKVVTRKSLMVRPYVPRFFREGDEATLKVSINNASKDAMSGIVTLKIWDADHPDGKNHPLNKMTTKWSANAESSTSISWNIKVPNSLKLYSFQAVAETDGYQDGELRPIPVLPSRMHLVQSKFVTLKENQERTMYLQDLEKALEDTSLIHQSLVVTVDAQLIYTVLNSLPYLLEYPYECTDSILYRFVASGIISSIYEQYPAIAKLAKDMAKRNTQWEAWNKEDANRKMSLEETPWLYEAEGGEKDLSKLVNMLDEKIAREYRQKCLKLLREIQYSNGAFPWWRGGDGSMYMTLCVLYGFAKAREFQVNIPKDMVQKAWKFVLEEYQKYYSTHKLGYHFITFLNYVLSCYDASYYEGSFTEQQRKIMLEDCFANWRNLSPYLKAYLALTLHRMNRSQDARLVLESIMDSAITKEDQGTFWAREDRSWLWYNDNIESHSFILRTLQEVMPDDTEHIDGLVLWLLLNKKCNHWKSTRATAETLYSLLYTMQKQNALGVEESATINIGNQHHKMTFKPDTYTGAHQQIVIPAEKIEVPSMSKVQVAKQGPGYMFASMVWHYSTEKMPEEDRNDFIAVSREYYLRVHEGNGYVLKPLSEGATIHVGDEVEIHLSIRSKHPMEYVHLRDPRGAGFEPESFTSGHKYNLGIRWYEEIRDSGMNFFFENLPQGEYPFKYRIKANMAGKFKVGPATLQGVYAPEFSAFSSGIILNVLP